MATDELEVAESPAIISLSEKVELALKDGALSEKADSTRRKAELAAMIEPGEEESGGETSAEHSREELEDMPLDELETLVAGIEEPPAEEEALPVEEEKESEKVTIDLTPEEQEALEHLNAQRANDWFSFDAVPIPTDEEVEGFEAFVAKDPKHARRVVEYNDRVAAAKGHVQGYHKGRVDNNPIYKENIQGIRWVLDNRPEVFDTSKFKDPVVAAVALLKNEGKYKMPTNDKVKSSVDKKKEEAAKRAKLIADHERKKGATLAPSKKAKREDNAKKIDPRVLAITGLTEAETIALRKARAK